MSQPIACGSARGQLWPGTGPQLATDAAADAQAHVAGCEACRDFMADMAALAAAIQHAASTTPAPPAVRERLFQAVARARTAAPVRFQRRAWAWVALAATAAVVLSAIGVSLALRNRGLEGVMATLAEDHIRATAGGGIVSADSLTVARWLARRTSVPVHVPFFPSARLKGGRLHLGASGSGAVLEYELGGRLLSYYVVPAAPGIGGRRTRSAGDAPGLQHFVNGGYRVVAWEDSGVVHALVADLPQARLTALAHYCISQVMQVAVGRRPARGVWVRSPITSSTSGGTT